MQVQYERYNYEFNEVKKCNENDPKTTGYHHAWT